MCLFYLILRSGVLMFRIPGINQCVKNFLRLGKVEFIKFKINLINVLFIGFVNQWFSAYQDQFCVWFNLVSLDSGLLENFSVSFSKKENRFIFLFVVRLCFSYMFNASAIPFLFLSFAQSCKIFSKFLKLFAILKRRRTTL